MKGWLTYLGGRRPQTLRTQGQYDEAVSRPAAAPVAHDNGPNVAGERLGRGPGRHAYAARHRAE